VEAAARDLEQETSLNLAEAAARDPAAAGVQDRRAVVVVVAMGLAAMAQEQETELDLTMVVTVLDWVTLVLLVLVLVDRASAPGSSWPALAWR